MDNFNENNLLITEIRDLIVTDCQKQLSNVQNCGMLIDICNEYENLVTCFAIISDNKKESWPIKNVQILNKARMLQEKMGKKWDSIFFAINLENNQFLVEYYVENEKDWQKPIFDGEGKWKYYMEMLTKI